MPGDKAVGHVAEEAARQRLRCLLCEPEVLALLWQHEAVFKQLHRCYADDRGRGEVPAVSGGRSGELRGFFEWFQGDFEVVAAFLRGFSGCERRSHELCCRGAALQRLLAGAEAHQPAHAPQDLRAPRRASEGLGEASEAPKEAFFGRFPLSSGLKWHQSKWTPGPWRPLTWIWMTSLGGSGMFVTEAGGGKARGRDSTGPGPLRKAQFMAFSELLVLFWVAFGPFLAAGELFEAFLFEVSVWRRRRR